MSPRSTLWRVSTLVLLAISVAYATVQRQLAGWTPAVLAHANVWDNVIRVVFDPYVLMFLFVPWMMSSAARDATFTASDLVLFRAGNYWRWACVASRSGVARLAQVGAAIGASVAATLPGFKPSATWSLAATDPRSPLSLSMIVDLGLPPIAVVLLQLGMVGVSLLGLYLLVSVAALVGGGVASSLVAAVLWVVIVVDFKFSLPLPFSLAAGMVVNLAAAVMDSVFLAPLVALMPGVAAAAVIGTITGIRGGGLSRVRRAQVLYFAAAGLAVSAATSSSAVPSMPETLLVALYGATPEGTQIGRYLLFVIVFVGWVYLFGLGLEYEMDGHFELVAIRAGSLWRWWRCFSAPWYLGSLMVPAGSLVIATVVAGVETGWTLEPGADLVLMMIYQWLINGTLQLWFYLGLIFLARWAIPGAGGSVAALCAFAVAGLPFFQAYGIPSMAHSLGYVFAGWPSLLAITMRLLVGNLVCLMSIVVVMQTRRSVALERFAR